MLCNNIILYFFTNVQNKRDKNEIQKNINNCSKAVLKASSVVFILSIV